MAQTLGFVFAGASTVLGLAMLLLVVWQAPHHRHNRLMAIYLGTLVFWGASNVAARLSALLGASPITYTYNNLLGNGLNAVALLWFVTDYVGIGRRPWVRAARALALVWLALASIALYRGLLLTDVAITADGLWLYRLTPIGLLAADRFKLREQLAAAVHLLGAAASRKRLELVLDVADAVPDGLIGDPRRLCQVLVNLVGNAIKFTERGHVLVRVEREAETYGGARLRFEVADTGIGITELARARLFEPFVQDRDRPGGGHDGVGLGLAISRRLVEAMGGRLEVESEPGHGSTFAFTLPFMCGPAVPAPVVDLSGVSVLVLDDSETLGELLRRWLTRWRVRPTLVADAEAARAALDRAQRAGTRFGLLLVDLDTKGADALMTDPVGGVATVVMLPATAEVVGDGGAGDRVVRIRKPFTPDQLRAALGAARSGVDGAAPASRRARRTARPLRILVAEDSLTNLAIATTLLERWGHTVAQAGNGTQAVAAVHEAPYDLIVMDLAMPGVDGLEATRRIRAAERGTPRRVPIVAMTASAMKGDRERCLEAGMDAYLAKPIDADELFEVVEGFAAPALSDGAERPGRERFADAFDAAAIVDRLDGDHAAARTMARLFLMEYPRCLGDLRAALGRGDAAAVMRAAHALKGSIGLFGALGYDAARRLELIGQQGALAEAPGALRLLETELSRLLPMVNELADVDGGTYKEDSWRRR